MNKCQFYKNNLCTIMPNNNCENDINIGCPYRERLAWETILDQVKYLNIEHKKQILQIAINEMNKIKYMTTNMTVN